MSPKKLDATFFMVFWHFTVQESRDLFIDGFKKLFQA